MKYMVKRIMSVMLTLVLLLSNATGGGLTTHVHAVDGHLWSDLPAAPTAPVVSADESLPAAPEPAWQALPADNTPAPADWSLPAPMATGSVTVHLGYNYECWSSDVTITGPGEYTFELNAEKNPNISAQTKMDSLFIEENPNNSRDVPGLFGVSITTKSVTINGQSCNLKADKNGVTKAMPWADDGKFGITYFNGWNNHSLDTVDLPAEFGTQDALTQTINSIVVVVSVEDDPSIEPFSMPADPESSIFNYGRTLNGSWFTFDESNGLNDFLVACAEENAQIIVQTSASIGGWAQIHINFGSNVAVGATISPDKHSFTVDGKTFLEKYNEIKKDSGNSLVFQGDYSGWNAAKVSVVSVKTKEVFNETVTATYGDYKWCTALMNKGTPEIAKFIEAIKLEGSEVIFTFPNTTDAPWIQIYWQECSSYSSNKTQIGGNGHTVKGTGEAFYALITAGSDKVSPFTEDNVQLVMNTDYSGCPEITSEPGSKIEVKVVVTVPDDTELPPDPTPTCPNEAEHIANGWTKVDPATVTTNNTDTYYVPFANGEKAYEGETVDYCFIGTFEEAEAIHFFIADGANGSNNDLTPSVYATLDGNTFKVSGTTDALTAKDDHTIGNYFYFKAPNDGSSPAISNVEFTHIYYHVNHVHKYDGNKTGYDGKNHWTACDVCGEPKEGTSQPHTYTNEADGSRKCSVCGFTHPANETELDISGAKFPFNDGDPHTFPINNLSKGDKVTVHFVGQSDSDFRIWLSNGEYANASDIIVASDKYQFKNGFFDYTVELTCGETLTGDTPQSATADSIQFKGNSTLTNFTLTHLGIVYPGCDHPADKQVSQFSTTQHWTLCTACNTVISEKTAHTMQGLKCTGCDFEHYENEKEIELTKDIIKSDNLDAITVENGVVKVEANKVEWLSFDFGRTVMNGEKVSVHLIGEIVGGAANDNGYLRAWLGDTTNKSEGSECADINKTSDGIFYNGYFQMRHEFTHKYDYDAAHSFALKANSYGTKLPELNIEHLAVVLPICPHNVDSENHEAWLEGNYVKYVSKGATQHDEVCTLCGETIVTEDHAKSEVTSKNDKEHGWSCTKCDYTATEAHTFEYEYVDASNHTVTCTGCDYEKTAAHTPGDEWVEDDEGRYHLCVDCNGKCDVTEHDYVCVPDEDGSGHHMECKTCGHVKAGSSEDHTYEDGKCTECGYVHPEDAHEWSGWTADKGADTHSRECTVCHKTETSAHTFGTEIKDGGDYHYTECTVCKEQKTEEHTYGDWIYVDGETHKHVCKCGHEESKPHTLSKEYASDSINHWHECTECKDETGKAGTSAKENHVYPEGEDHCSVCNYWNHQHSYVWEHDDTQHWQRCTAEGCGHTTAKEDHRFGDYRYDAKTHEKVCEVCAARVSEEHTFPEKDGKPVYEHDKGTHWQVCEVCGYETHAQAHEVEIIKGKPATCVDDGITDGEFCTVCGYVIKEQETIKATGVHTYAEGKYEKDAEEHWQICEVCKQESEHVAHDYDEGVCTACEYEHTGHAPAAGAKYTPTQEGHTYLCEVCHKVVFEDHTVGKEYKTNDKSHWHECEKCFAHIGEAEHTLKCISDGEVTHHSECEVCGYKSAAENHNWDDGKITVEPTYTKEGVKTFTCKDCGAEKTETVSKVPHEHEYVMRSDASGHWNECTVCGEKKDAEAHTPSEWIIDSEATHETAGKRHKECTVCGYVTDEVEMPAIGDIDVDIPTEGDVPKVQIPADMQEQLKQSLITEEDAKEIENGSLIDIEMTVENAESSVDPVTKQKADSKTAEIGYSHGCYFEISLEKVTTTASGSTTSVEITELVKPIRIAMDIPASLRGFNRTFAVIRVHGDSVDVLNDLDSDPNTVTFETDRFSSYTLIYKNPAIWVPAGSSHTHIIGPWLNDNLCHWRQCVTCTMRIDYAEHSFVDGVCTVCGYADPLYTPGEVIDVDAPTAPTIHRTDAH